MKSRAYGARGDDGRRLGASAALRLALDALQRLFAPFLPFVTDEVWSWWQEGSIHLAAWPTPTSWRRARPPTPRCSTPWARCSPRVRRAKTEAKVSQRSPVDRLQVAGPADFLSAISLGEDDLRAAGGIATLDLTESDDGVSVGVVLAAPTT